MEKRREDYREFAEEVFFFAFHPLYIYIYTFAIGEGTAADSSAVCQNASLKLYEHVTWIIYVTRGESRAIHFFITGNP
jgi:hypothetical protein